MFLVTPRLSTPCNSFHLFFITTQNQLSPYHLQQQPSRLATRPPRFRSAFSFLLFSTLDSRCCSYHRILSSLTPAFYLCSPSGTTPPVTYLAPALLSEGTDLSFTPIPHLMDALLSAARLASSFLDTLVASASLSVLFILPCYIRCYIFAFAPPSRTLRRFFLSLSSINYLFPSLFFKRSSPRSLHIVVCLNS